MSTINELKKAQSTCKTYEEWLEISSQIDKLSGTDLWKDKDESPIYDYVKIRKLLTSLREARNARDYKRLLYLIRTTFSRNVGNMGDPRLYNHSQCGTKTLIEEYITECELCLKAMSQSVLDNKEVLAMLAETRKAFGHTALVLSGGSVMGYIHGGLVKQLLESGLLPKIISGTSAGSIFASLICIIRDEDMDKIWSKMDEPFGIFEPLDEPETYMTRIKRFCTVGSWIDSRFLRETMRDLLGDITFQEAYNLTGRVLNVTVSVRGQHDMPRLLNYLTAPNVLIWSAVVCSCSVPLVFSADNILAKDLSTKKIYPWTQASFMDGSMENDMPIGRLTEMFNVNHFVACQVNPHIAPLIPRPGKSPEIKLGGGGWLSSKLYNALRTTTTFLLNEIEYTLTMLQEANILKSFSSTFLSLICQTYYGDVTIIPKVYLSDVHNLLKNPDIERVHEMFDRGLRATWPNMALIRNHCAVELALDNAIVDLRSKIIEEYKQNEKSEFEIESSNRGRLRSNSISGDVFREEEVQPPPRRMSTFGSP